MLAVTELSESSLIAEVEELRLRATSGLTAERRGEFGQFLTPVSVAEMTADLFSDPPEDVRLLEAGAGTGSLIAAALVRLLRAKWKPRRFEVTAYELDETLRPFLGHTLSLCNDFCHARGVKFNSKIIAEDFVFAAADRLEPSLFKKADVRFTHAILNPPYRKINLGSDCHHILQKLGLASTNLYTAFLELTSMLLVEGGEVAAIVPRSFCNGTYFRPFRERFLALMSLRQIHSFASRSQAFKGDAVLQENVILHAVRSAKAPDSVRLIVSEGPTDDAPTVRAVPFADVVLPNDPEHFIHLVPDELGQAIASQLRSLPDTLASLGLSVSTGPVVDFRSTAHLRRNPERGAVPLLYPVHMVAGQTVWPREGKKPNAIAVTPESKPWLVPDETYVLIKRFSAKEERRRVVAAVHVPEERFRCIGIENHLNFIHRNHRGLEPNLAYGLSVFLNSTHLDEFFRQFSGHTQVNAGDLRKMPFPSMQKLEALGKCIGPALPEQAQIDKAVTDLVFGGMANDSDPMQAMQKIDSAQEILKALGLPKAQQNERSALCLLALLNVLPQTPWANAESPLCGMRHAKPCQRRVDGCRKGA